MRSLSLSDDQEKQLDSLALAVKTAHDAKNAAQTDADGKHQVADVADAAAQVADASLASAKAAESQAIDGLLAFLQGLGVTPSVGMGFVSTSCYRV